MSPFLSNSRTRWITFEHEFLASAALCVSAGSWCVFWFVVCLLVHGVSFTAVIRLSIC
jgi:hypothetical protein